MAEVGVDFPLVHGSAEAVPLADETFDWNLDWARRWPAECVWKVRKA